MRPMPAGKTKPATELPAEDAAAALKSVKRPIPARFAWAEDIFSIGVTGTNGKTSTTHLIASALQGAGKSTIRQSTLGYELDGEPLEVVRTEAGFHEAMHTAASRGCRHAAIEVTSTALRNGWALRWRFDLAVFTNLSRDHLDQHGTFEHYLASKAQLFVHLGPGRTAILNACDECAQLIDRAMPDDVQRIWYASPTRGQQQRPADLVARSIELTPHGTEVALEESELANRLGGRLSLNLIGEVFAENALAAAAAAVAAGADPAGVCRGIASCPVPGGRFEVLADDPLVVIDYAHTPDALARVCDSARKLAGAKRLVVVFGAGGARDQDKREPMGRAVGSRSDTAIVTNDNPRAEDPRVIAEAVAAGCRAAGLAETRIIYDRTDAIRCAIEEARDGDVIVVAGRGRDQGMHFANGTVPYDDATAIAQILKEKGRTKR